MLTGYLCLRHKLEEKPNIHRIFGEFSQRHSLPFVFRVIEKVMPRLDRL
jgi:hypothetical protein